MENKFKTLIWVAGIALICAMGAFMFSTLQGESIIIDEDPHIGAGYSYITKGDFRINAEHPPLMKDLGALPLTTMHLNEPWDHKSWVEDINGQWEFGRALIFGSGNDADAITFAAKVPMVLFTLALGLVIFFWTRKQFGGAVALITTFFYAFSPTFLAHGRFVTTDVGASAGFFVATTAFLRFLKKPSAGNVVLAGFGLGFAFLAKFSTFMLLPIFAILALLWIIAARKAPAITTLTPGGVPHHAHLPFTSKGTEHAETHFGDIIEAPVRFWDIFWKSVAVVIIGYLFIYPIYWHHTRNYPPDRQRADTISILTTYKIGLLGKAADLMESKNILAAYSPVVRDFPKNAVIWASDKPGYKAYAEYFLGLLMVFQRSAGGNTNYFLETVSKYGSVWYFPVVYALKEPLALHLLTLIVVIYALSRIKRPPCRREWLVQHFTEIAFVIVIAFYWWASMRSILNIGVRHVLPTFPFIYVLVALGLTRIYTAFATTNVRRWVIAGGAAVVLVWQAASVTLVYPSYLAYFNEIAGGADGGAKYVVDSNLDWGQDLKRLKVFVDERAIAEIYVDYFGWADIGWYLGDRYRGLSSCNEPKKGWVAVSASFYQGSREKPECDYRRWLPLENRVASIGHSIFVWYVE